MFMKCLYGKYFSKTFGNKMFCITQEMTSKYSKTLKHLNYKCFITNSTHIEFEQGWEPGGL